MDLIRRRIKNGCLVPGPSEVSASAVLALGEQAEVSAPNSLFSAERSVFLSGYPNNTVPETMIVSHVLKDSTGSYLQCYRDSAKRSLKEMSLTKSKAWGSIVARYWKYLRLTNRIELNIEEQPSALPKGNDLAHLILRSTFAASLLSEAPFKDKSTNAAYAANFKDMRATMDTVQRYMYFMRPEDPMVPSEDTALRLKELMAYAAVSYRWLLWFLDLFDSKILSYIGVSTNKLGPRETKHPEQFFSKHIRSAACSTGESDCAMALSTSTSGALTALIKMSATWTECRWKSNTQSMSAAIVAAVEVVTFVHHHIQYILNMLFSGYICWSAKGAEDQFIISALRAQGRFCHFAGTLAPTMTVHSWAAMESGTAAWFKYSLARSILLHGGITDYYSRVLKTINPDDGGNATSGLISTAGNTFSRCGSCRNSERSTRSTRANTSFTQEGVSRFRRTFSARASVGERGRGRYKSTAKNTVIIDADDHANLLGDDDANNPYLHMSPIKSPKSTTSLRRTKGVSDMRSIKEQDSYWYTRRYGVETQRGDMPNEYTSSCYNDFSSSEDDSVYQCMKRRVAENGDDEYKAATGHCYSNPTYSTNSDTEYENVPKRGNLRSTYNKCDTLSTKCAKQYHKRLIKMHYPETVDRQSDNGRIDENDREKNSDLEPATRSVADYEIMESDLLCTRNMRPRSFAMDSDIAATAVEKLQCVLGKLRVSGENYDSIQQN
ncbi:tegument protein VP11/12 [Spheniscid alphaherpesvirus 1]|uniref:Tegument protein VP11/12 n=1 Tax=Spheniscid alphaherpesvirus 1 TaxID=2560777 RepID=A0A1R3T8L4_9ALPH|nr:tegument protein VP11/12 [Spheniscid alphaherpesvirus 1]SCO83509.1 tegument protein VP11/12 [Spheniscid alphaherpesvirus 1]